MPEIVAAENTRVYGDRGIDPGYIDLSTRCSMHRIRGSRLGSEKIHQDHVFVPRENWSACALSDTALHFRWNGQH